MPNPIVDGLQAEASSALERWFDRWKLAIESARNGNYAFEQFAADVTESWIDGVYVNLLPLSSAFNILSITRTQLFPVVRFPLLNKNDTTRVVTVPTIGSFASIASEHLMDAFNTNKIPNTNVTLTLPTGGSTLVTVALKNLTTISPMPPAGFYSGRIIGTPGNVPLARIEVLFP